MKVLEVGLIQGTRYWEDVEEGVYWRKSIGVLDAILLAKLTCTKVPTDDVP